MPTPSRRRPPARKGPTSAIWLGLLAVVILGGGTTLAILKKQQSQAATTSPEDAGPQPFADMPPETAPTRRSPGAGDASQPFSAPASLLSDPVWQRAVELATEGEALYQEAVAAKTEGDVETLNAKGNQAKAKLDEALESTAQLEEDLIAKRGDTDLLVRKVQATRNTWFDRVRWLHKSTSR